jgi:hypothetical protein
MLKLLPGVKKTLFTHAKYLTLIAELHKLNQVMAGKRGFAVHFDSKDKVTNWYVTHADLSGKSGSTTVRQYRVENKIPSQWCGSPDKVVANIADNSGKVVVVCVDDFVGTGQSALHDLQQNVIPRLETLGPDWFNRVLLIYAAIVGFESGLQHIEDEFSSLVSVVCTHRLTDADKAFHEENNLFSSVDERLRARKIASDIGLKLEKKHPLGWEDSQALVVFPETVPNNTLPILYKDKGGSVYEGKPWKALFRRS